MDATTAKALEDSIAHWKRMRDDPFCGEKPFDGDCPLCALFYFESPQHPHCEGCPVGHTGCVLTPYTYARDIWAAMRDRKEIYGGPLDPDQLAQWRHAASAEIEFLESLRD
jgi:hypothetical protein